MAPIVDIEDFVKNMSQNNAITGSNTINSLTAEFEHIESQYIRLRKDISFTPFYESLIDRIAITQSTATDDYSKNTMKFLYTAVKSRLFAIGTKKNYVAVANVKIYLNSIEEKISKLKTTNNTIHINELRTKFKNELDVKIKNAEKMINENIMPFIKERIDDTRKGVGDVLEELRNDTKTAEQNKKKAEENEETLRKRAIWNSVLGSIDLIGTAIAMVPLPQTMIAGTGIKAVTGVANVILDQTYKMHTITIPAKLNRERVLKITKNARKQFIDFESQFKQLKVILEDESLIEFKKLNNDKLQEMEKLIPQIESVTNKTDDNYFLSLSKEEMENLKKGMSSMDDFLKALSENEKIKSNKKVSKGLGALKYGLAFGSDAIDLINRTVGDWKNVDSAKAITRQIEQQITLMKLQEINILEVMMPQLQMVMQKVNSVAREGKSQDHVHLDIARWSIQNTLGDVKHQFNEMSKGFAANDDLKICIRKISEAITTVIDVHNRMDSYRDTAQMADLIVDISIAQSREVPNPYMELIKRNLIIEQYETAINAVKHHVFPFAKAFLGNSKFVKNPMEDDFFDDVENNIEIIMDQLGAIEASITTIGSYILLPSDFVLDEAFYRWDQRTFNKEIDDLLNGHEVILNADINNGLNHSAMKFNEIWIRFILNDKNKEREFNEVIGEFRLKMKMVGNQYYRCDNRVYYTPLEEPIELLFNMNNAHPNQIIRASGTFGTLNHTDSFLSPYTTWSFTLTVRNGNFAKLQPFITEVSEILLEGKARHIEDKHVYKQFMEDICTESLDQYYSFDGISYIN